MDGKERAEVQAYYEKAIVCAVFLPPPGDTEMTNAAWLILGLLQDSERAERYRKALVEIERDAETFKEAVLIAHKVLKDNRD